MTFIPRRGDGHVSFVAVGRLSPEKNHDRLLRAFALVHEDHPHARLVILGDGRLMPQVSATVARLGLHEVVSLAGHVDNPYAIMRECDCFVISSDYEGQPMVVLEARTLGLPIIATEFPSVAGSVPEGAGLIVERTVPALASAMVRALVGEVPSSRLDWDTYNRDAMRQFYRAIGAEAQDSPAAQ